MVTDLKQYKALLHQLVDEFYSVHWLRAALVYMATLNEKKLVEEDGVLKLVEKVGER